LFYSVELESAKHVQKFIKLATKEGVITDWFIFLDNRFRIAPPLIITKDEIDIVVGIIKKDEINDIFNDSKNIL